MTHGPVEERYAATMRAVAEAIDEAFNPPGLPGLPRVKSTGWVLLTFPFNTDRERINYMSNGDRADIVAALHELLARFEGRYVATPDTPQ
jgi:hypothetical protein